MSKRSLNKFRHRADKQHLTFGDRVRLGMEIKKMANASNKEAVSQSMFDKAENVVETVEHVHGEHCNHDHK